MLDTSDFLSDGWAGPIDLLTPREVTILNGHIRAKDRPAPMVWNKGLAVADRVFYDLASDSRLKRLLKPLLGNDWFIWGASIIERAPGEAHFWHTDIESEGSDGKVVSVWIPLLNGTPKSSLCFISGSHKFNKSLQQAAAEKGLNRYDRSAASSLSLAQGVSEKCSLVQPLIRNGQALLFDGRTWHGSLNQEESGIRRSLILQYARSDCKIRIPDWKNIDWPFKFKKSPKPPVVPICGNGSGQLNRTVAPPLENSPKANPLRNLIRNFPQPLNRNPVRGWQPNPFYFGSTPVLRKISCHASVLEPGHSPHKPHSHLDEEILVILEGNAEILIASSADDPDPRTVSMQSGDLVYYPSCQFHTIRSTGSEPLSYFMYRWNAKLNHKEVTKDVVIVKSKDHQGFDENRLFDTSLIFEGATDLLDKLHIHYSRVKKNGGYRKHRDKHDVAILLLNGKVKTLGRIVEAPAVIFHPANALHGLTGVSEEPAYYQVVEFHGRHSKPPPLLTIVDWKIRAGLDRVRRAISWRLKKLRRSTNHQ